MKHQESVAVVLPIAYSYQDIFTDASDFEKTPYLSPLPTSLNIIPPDAVS